MMILLIAAVALMVIANGFLLSKAGENGWKILIPYYGGYKLYASIGATSLYYANIGLTVASNIFAESSFLSIVIMLGSLAVQILYSVKLGKAYGKSGGFITGLALLPFVFLPILAFGNSQLLHKPAANKEKKNVSVQPAGC